jgi:hypothetical protein
MGRPGDISTPREGIVKFKVMLTLGDFPDDGDYDGCVERYTTGTVDGDCAGIVIVDFDVGRVGQGVDSVDVPTHTMFGEEFLHDSSAPHLCSKHQSSQ